MLRIDCRHKTDSAACSASARRFAEENGLDGAGAAAVAICVAELVSNAVRHAGGGALELRAVEGARGVEIVVRDEGPGLPADLAVQDGWSRGAMMEPDAPRRDGLGRGLGAVLRLMDESRIECPPGGGTIVCARKFARAR